MLALSRWSSEGSSDQLTCRGRRGFRRRGRWRPGRRWSALSWCPGPWWGVKRSIIRGKTENKKIKIKYIARNDMAIHKEAAGVVGCKI